MAKDPSELKRLHSTAADVPPPAVHDSAPVDGIDGQRTYLGKYELVDVLGVGGMGVIYSGRQIFLDRMVAIKMLKNNLASVKQRHTISPGGKGRIRSEAPRYCSHSRLWRGRS